MSERLNKLLEQIPSPKRRMIKMHQQVVEFVVENLEEKGWDQQDLAREMGVNPASLSRSLSYNGTPNLTIETIAKIGDPFGKDVFARRAEVLDELTHEPKELWQIFATSLETENGDELCREAAQNSRIKNAVLYGVFNPAKTIQLGNEGELSFNYSYPRPEEKSSQTWVQESEKTTLPALTNV